MKKLLIILSMLFFASCSSLPSKMTSQIPDDRDQYKEVMLENVGAPDWVINGAGSIDDGKVYGVGSSIGMKDISIMMLAADTSARADLVSTMRSRSSILTKNYKSATTNQDYSKSNTEKLFETATRTFADATLSGVVIIKRWQHPTQNQMWSLAVFNYDKMKDAIKEFDQLSEQARVAIAERAEKMHQELMTQLDSEIEVKKN